MIYSHESGYGVDADFLSCLDDDDFSKLFVYKHFADLADAHHEHELYSSPTTRPTPDATGSPSDSPTPCAHRRRFRR